MSSFCSGLVALLVALPSAQTIPQDTGAAGAWQKILKARTTASVMHTTAHPDDEHGGVITRLSRRDGARLALMTLNRGESGDNAIGPQLFDGLGLIRTEELRVADRYYGVDEQYFTTVVDYGFSKRLEEAFEKWGKENVMRDVVRVIRTSRPLVLLSRFQGNERDGHGNHQTAGLHHRAGLQAGRRSERCIPSRSRKACGRGSRSRSTSAACARTRTGPCASTAASTAPSSATPTTTSPATA